MSNQQDSRGDPTPRQDAAGGRGRARARRRAIGSWPQVILAVLATGAALYAGRVLFAPIVTAVLLSAMFLPLVRGLTRFRLPAPLAAGVVILGLLGVSYAGVARLTAPALEWMEELPQALRAAKPKLASLRRPVDQVTKAAESIEDAASDGKKDDAIEVVQKEPGLSGRLLARIGNGAQGAAITLFLLYFLLADGVSFLGRSVALISNRPSRRIWSTIVRSVESQIARYVATITLINVALGLCVGVAMFLLGVPNPALWGAFVALLNFVPYVGAVIGITVLGAVALVTFDTPTRILLPPLTYFLLNGIEGMLISPLIIGRRWLLRPTIVFVWLVLWGWLWGIPGALLASPMLVAFKIVCDNLPSLSPVGAFLGRAEEGASALPGRPRRDRPAPVPPLGEEPGIAAPGERNA